MNEIENYFKVQSEESFQQANSYFQAGDFRQALIYYARAFEFDPTNKIALYNRGVCKIQIQNFTEAVLDFEYLINHFDESPEVYASYAFAKNQLNDKFAALHSYNKALELKPDLKEAYYNRGNLKLEFDDFQGAIEDFTESIKFQPNYANAYNNRGNAYFILGQFEEAITDYDQTLALEPKHNQVYNNRGLCQSNLGNLNAALKDFERAKEIFLEQNNQEKYNLMLSLIDGLKQNLQENLNASILGSLNKLKL